MYITPPEVMPHYHYDTPKFITAGENVPRLTKRVPVPEQHSRRSSTPGVREYHS